MLRIQLDQKKQDLILSATREMQKGATANQVRSNYLQKLHRLKEMDNAAATHIAEILIAQYHAHQKQRKAGDLNIYEANIGDWIIKKEESRPPIGVGKVVARLPPEVGYCYLCQPGPSLSPPEAEHPEIVYGGEVDHMIPGCDDDTSIQHYRAKKRLKPLLNSSREACRVTALRAALDINCFDDNVIKKLLKQLLSGKNKNVREEALRLAGRTGITGAGNEARDQEESKC